MGRGESLDVGDRRFFEVLGLRWIARERQINSRLESNKEDEERSGIRGGSVRFGDVAREKGRESRWELLKIVGPYFA